jgi:hypothetical protein
MELWGTDGGGWSEAIQVAYWERRRPSRNEREARKGFCLNNYAARCGRDARAPSIKVAAKIKQH